jgi:hypothetical protein
MPGELPVGPYRTITTKSGLSFPYYIVPFDKEGVCTGPLTQDHLLEALKRGNPTDVFLFSHGWNNDWEAATERYEHFLEGFLGLADERAAGDPDRHELRPVLVGVFWPSTALVWPWEEAPEIAAVPGTADDRAVNDAYDEARDLAALVKKSDQARFYALVQAESLDEAEARELAGMLLPAFNAGDPDVPFGRPRAGEPLTEDELVKVWLEVAPVSQAATDTSGTVRPLGEDRTVDGGPSPAGFLEKIDPRKILRMRTVRQMKDRAGRVGANGVADLLHAILDATDAQVHLIGHSYGCRVLLSALCIRQPPRPVNSVLLLQPAISHLCFAANVAGSGKPGGYRKALNPKWVTLPIFTTFTPQDFPLREVFHRVFWRDQDLGEMEIAAGAPNRWAALGGYGPGDCANDCTSRLILQSGTSYGLETMDKRIRVIGLDADNAIEGHGEVSNPYTWWALYEQVYAKGAAG